MNASCDVMDAYWPLKNKNKNKKQEIIDHTIPTKETHNYMCLVVELTTKSLKLHKMILFLF